jgi:hypothetical protein
MDGSRFDAWTRRRFGVAAAGLVVGFFAVAGWDDAPAKRKHKKHKKPRPRQCEQMHTHCNPKNDRKMCCGGLGCSHVTELGGNHCCLWRYFACDDDVDCCGNLKCLGTAEGRFCDTLT